MSNERERLARQWAEFAKSIPSGSPAALAAAEHILATTTPPAMDEVEWDQEKHALTGAVVDVGGGPVDVVMLAGSVDGIDYATLDGKFGYAPRFYFTPNGKRYRLAEVGATVSPDENVGDDQGEHPRTLTTEEDYENAPNGTVVTERFRIWCKNNGAWYATESVSVCLDWEMSHSARRMLRWGWGE